MLQRKRDDMSTKTAPEEISAAQSAAEQLRERLDKIEKAARLAALGKRVDAMRRGH